MSVSEWYVSGSQSGLYRAGVVSRAHESPAHPQHTHGLIPDTNRLWWLIYKSGCFAEWALRLPAKSW